MIGQARRFFKQATIAPVADGAFAIMLDKRELKSPAGARVVVPTRALAEAVAEEWESQAERIEPRTMQITQMVFAALDGGPGARQERVDFVAAFAETDLCCHRAGAPSELTAIQEAVWGPLLRCFEEDLGVNVPVTTGVIAAPAPRAVEAVIAFARQLDEFSLVGFAQAVGLSGSVVIGFALLRGRIAADGAFEAATVDEAWNMKHWGRDDEAVARLDRLRVDLAAAARYLRVLRHD